MRSGIICLLALCAASAVLAEQVSYEGYKVWRISAKTEVQREALQSWEKNENVDFWEPLSLTDRPLRIMIAPNTQIEFLNFLETAGIEHELIIDNVEPIFAEERRVDAEYREKVNRQPAGTRFVADFNHFWSTLEFNNYLTHLLAFHNDICSTEVVGFSFQGQLIRALSVSLRGRGQIDGSRPIVFVDAGIHAREWATQTTAIHMIHQLVERRTENLDILNNIDFVFLPITNPDGYEHSRLNDRMWRKTRKPVMNPTTGEMCYGTDGNRNYGHMWHSGDDPCADTYPGTGPFSEPETQAVRAVFDRYGRDIKVYVSLHTHGALVLYPWGYGEGTWIDNWQLHDDIGHIFREAILESTGRNYTVGNAVTVLGPAYGASDDYSASVGVETSFTYALPGGGEFGFDLPVSQINGVATEIWTGFRELLRFAATHEWSDDHQVVFPTTAPPPPPDAISTEDE